MEDEFEGFTVLDDLPELRDDEFMELNVDSGPTMKEQLDSLRRTNFLSEQVKLNDRPEDLTASLVLFVPESSGDEIKNMAEEGTQESVHPTEEIEIPIALPLEPTETSEADLDDELHLEIIQKDEMKHTEEAEDDWFVMEEISRPSSKGTAEIQLKTGFSKLIGTLRKDSRPTNSPTSSQQGKTTKSSAPSSQPQTIICNEPGCNWELPQSSASCYKCGKKFCGNHCKTTEDLPNMGWKRQIKCILNTPDDILFEMMERDESLICYYCEETYFQPIGKCTDHTNRFNILRKRSVDTRKQLLVSHLDTICETLTILQQDMKNSPISTSLLASLNPMKNLALTKKDTYTACALCDKFFEQFKAKKTCQLCQKFVCQECGTSQIRFSTRLFPKVEQVAGMFALKACQRCRQAVAFQSRSEAYQSRISVQRSRLMDQRHEILQEHRDKSDELLEKFFTFATLSEDAKKCKDAAEGELKCFHRLSRLLETMGTKPLGKTLNKTECRFVRGLERSHHLVLKERTILLRTHENLLHVRAKEANKP